MLYHDVLDHGHVELLNISGPTRRRDRPFDAHDRDPANSARLSFNQRNTRSIDDDLRLTRYLWDHQHATPFEMIETWWEMQMPIFVARQLIRHRTASVNEMSARYVTVTERWYIPQTAIVGMPAGKQGRDVTVANPEAEWFAETLHGSCEHDYARYQEAISRGIPNEVARNLLHVNHYTKWLWKQDLRNLLHLLDLRGAPDAQWETQAYALAMIDALRGVLPELMAIVMPEPAR